MAWLRIDDGFTKHPKFEGWSRSDRWAWLEVMEYCARYRTRGRVPTDLDLLPRAVTPAFLKRAEKSGWCTRKDDGALWINDWDVYNPPSPEVIDELVADAFKAAPDASANEVYKAIGGSRNLVLAAVKRYHSGTTTGTQPGMEAVRERYEKVVSRAHPVPSPTNSGEERPQGATPPRPHTHYDTPATSLGAEAPSAAEPSKGNGRKPRDETIAGDKPKRYKRHLAEAWMRNVGHLDPHPADALRAEFPDIPDLAVQELVMATLQTVPPDDENLFA